MTKKRDKLTQKAHKALDTFLKTKRKTKRGYAPFTKDDEIDFHMFMASMIEAKFEKDPDGSYPYPLQYKMVNRTHSEDIDYFPLPYLHRITSVEDGLNYLRLAEVNACAAASSVRQGIHYIRDMVADKKTYGGW